MNPLKWLPKLGRAIQRNPMAWLYGAAAVVALTIISKWTNIPVTW
jgi:hypothetical protein